VAMYAWGVVCIKRKKRARKEKRVWPCKTRPPLQVWTLFLNSTAHKPVFPSIISFNQANHTPLLLSLFLDLVQQILCVCVWGGGVFLLLSFLFFSFFDFEIALAFLIWSKILWGCCVSLYLSVGEIRFVLGSLS